MKNQRFAIVVACLLFNSCLQLKTENEDLKDGIDKSEIPSGFKQNNYEKTTSTNLQSITIDNLYYLKNSNKELIHYEPKNIIKAVDYHKNPNLKVLELIKNGGSPELYYFNGYVYLQISCEKLICENESSLYSTYQIDYEKFTPFSYASFLEYKYQIRRLNSNFICSKQGCVSSYCNHHNRPSSYPVTYHKL